MKKIFMLVAGLCSISAGAFADTITLAADVWCPYNCEANSDKPGILVEIAREAFKNNGDTLDYKVQDWSSAINDAESGKIAGILAATKDEAPGFVFPQYPEAVAADAFYSSKKSNWQFNGINSLKDRQLIIFKGYSYEEPLKSYIDQNKDNSARIKVLESKTGRQDALSTILSNDKAVVIEDAAVMDAFLNSQGKKNDLNKFDSGLPPTNIYIAFSPANPKAAQYAKAVADKVQEMRSSGEYQKLMQKYTSK